MASGLCVVIAAGNEDIDAAYTSPASSGCGVVVGATDMHDRRAGFSNYGPHVDLFAPGVDIRASWPTGSMSGATNLLSGTSMATAMVTGAAAQQLSCGGSASNCGGVIECATQGVVIDPGPDSPNRLLNVCP